MNNTVDILIQVRAQLAALQQTVDGMKRVGAAAGEAQRASSGFASVFGAGGGFGLGQVTLLGIAGSIMGAVYASVRYSAELEQQTIAFQSLLGSVDAAKDRMEDLAAFAAATPFALPEIVRASRVLQALTEGALASGDGLRIVGDAAAATGRSFDETAMWIGRLYAGLKSGTPVGEATQRLLEMGLVSGETARRLNEMAEKGLATGRAMDVVRETFKKTAGAMELQSQTLNGLTSTLGDSFKAIGSDAIQPAVKAMKEFLTVTLEVLGALDRAEDRRQKVNETSVQVLKRAVKPTSEQDRQAQIQEADAGIEVARKRLRELRDLQAQQEEATTGAGVRAWRILTSGGAVQYFRDQKEESDAALITSEMEALTIQLRAYDAAKRALRSTDGQGKAASAEVMTLEKELAAQRAAFEAKAGEWLTKNAASARELVAEYERSNLPIEKQVEVLQGILQAQELIRNHRESGAGGDLEKEQIRLETEQQMIPVKREIARLTKEIAAEEAKASREALKRDVETAGRGLDDRRNSLGVDRARLDADFRVGRLDRRDRELDFQRQEIQLLDEEIVRREKLRDLQTDDASRTEVQHSIDGLQRDRRGAARGYEQAAGSADPNSVSDQMRSAMTELEDQVPTLAEGIAITFKSTIGSAIASISDGIQGLIMGTKTWGSALRDIGVNVFQSILKNIVDMAVQWAVTHIVMKGISTAWVAFTSSLGWAQVGQVNAQEAAKTPALATNAAMASAGSFGISAIVGIAALVAGIGIAIAAAAGAFADGGYVAGPGGPRDDRVLARLSNGEFVVNASATSEHRPLLEALNSGRGIEVAPAGPTVNVGAAPVSVAVITNQDQFLRWAESTEGRKAIFDANRRSLLDMGVGS